MVEDRSVLSLQHAVAAIVLVDGRRYLLQERDDIPGIWYPGHWGCFGGAVEPGETPEEAFIRELFEELGWRPNSFALFNQLEFDLRPMGLARYYRKYYVTSMDSGEIGELKLGEGRNVQAFEIDEVLHDLRLTPYDAFAIYLHHKQSLLK